MRTVRSRLVAGLVLGAFLSAVLVAPSPAAAEYRDNSGDLKFGGGTTLVLVAVGLSVAALVTVLVLRSNRAKAVPQTSGPAVPAPEGALLPAEVTETALSTEGSPTTADPSAPDLRVSALSLARVGREPALDLQIPLDPEAAPGGNAFPELPAGFAGAVAITF